jgi:glycosyltransferase involved in cell wall biosynthesis
MTKVSIIMPAHNEEAVINRTLEALLQDCPLPEWEVIVVCNGCTDNTASIVSRYKSVKLIETPKASKVNALNLGDSMANGRFRVYLDADVSITADGINALVDSLNNDRLLAVSPGIKMDLSQSPWLVRAYYRIWLQMPFMSNGFMGAGMYVLGREGRKRFKKFPDVISDDGFVRGCFDDSEAMRVESVLSEVVAPTSIMGLIRIKTRSRLGLYQLLEKYPEMRVQHAKAGNRGIKALISHPFIWPAAIIYLSVNLICRSRASRLLRTNDAYQWETDRSSRTKTES